MAIKTSNKQQLDLLGEMRELPVHILTKPHFSQGPCGKHIVRPPRIIELICIQLNHIASADSSINIGPDFSNKELHHPLDIHGHVLPNCISWHNRRQHPILELPLVLQQRFGSGYKVLFDVLDLLCCQE